MGLKGYRLWAMGQLDSTCRAPPRRHRSAPRSAQTPQPQRGPPCSGTSLNLKKQTLKPVSHLLGSMVVVVTGCLLQAMGHCMQRVGDLHVGIKLTHSP